MQKENAKRENPETLVRKKEQRNKIMGKYNRFSLEFSELFDG